MLHLEDNGDLRNGYLSKQIAMKTTIDGHSQTLQDLKRFHRDTIEKVESVVSQTLKVSTMSGMAHTTE